MAIILVISGTTFATLGYIFSNEHKFHPIVTNLIRGIASIIISYMFARVYSIDVTFPSEHNFKYQFYRNCLMFIQMTTYAWAQFYLPLPVVVTLQATSPIFATIFDRIINKITLNNKQYTYLAIAFFGVLLTTNGNYIYFLITGTNPEKNSSFENYFTR